MSDVHRDLRAAFPKLGRFAVTSPRDVAYNCIAWAIGRDDVWMWPDKAGTALWPPDVAREDNIEAFVSAFETLGFVVCEDDGLEPGLQKIALFERQGRPTHAARQLDDGRWTSKCGKSVDIAHQLFDLEGETYGNLAAVMSKQTSPQTA